MSVLIGHASISEKGTINGAKGDSTKKEVCVRPWYNIKADYMAIHPDAAVRERHAKAVEDACANDNIGYGQGDRNTAYTEAKKVDFVIKNIRTKCNCDCSSLQNLAALVSGAKGVTYGSNGWTTVTMRAALKAAGYKIITDTTYLKSSDYCVRGAIYVKEGSHTITGLSNGSKADKTLTKAGALAGTSGSNAGGNKYMFELGIIKKGSKGAEVLLFQRIAKSTGDYTGDLDSEYGDMCVEACKKIQKRAGFTGKDVDGECGSKTWPKVLGI